MSIVRSGHTAILLPDGKVLVAGGNKCCYTIYDSAELYDPATDTWTATGSLITGRAGHRAVRLDNGNVLVVGGENQSFHGLASAELYNVASGTWSSAGSMQTARAGTHAAVLLPSGRVLVSGGRVPSGATFASAELYTPPLPASIAVVKTVGTDPDTCADTSILRVVPGTTVYYCYTITNTGQVTFTHHLLDDSLLGSHSFTAELPPGAFLNTVDYGLVLSAKLEVTTTNTVTWMATDSGYVEARASSSAIVYVCDPCQSSPPMTQVHISSFSADNQAADVILAWETASEVALAGFNLYRTPAAGGESMRITNSLIPATGNVEAGASYQFTDQPGPGRYVYELELVPQVGAPLRRGQVAVQVTPGQSAAQQLQLPLLQHR
jgi:hypothetical protein